MPRRPRIEFEGAIDHVMARGNARLKIVRDDGDRRRLIDGLERTVVRQGWELLLPLSRRHDPYLVWAVAAWLFRRHTEGTLRELAG